MRIDSLASFDELKKSEKIGVLLGLQNSKHFRGPDDVDLFFSLGQRVSQLTYNSRNLIGNGSTERRDDGISDFGIAIVQRMNKLGMAVDVSHCGDRTTLDSFEVSKKPVLITHANCRALVPHPRCKTDEAIKKMAATGGVMGITGVRMFVKVDEPTTIEDALNHFDHVARLVGVEHLGVGSDSDLEGYDKMPPKENEQLRAGFAAISAPMPPPPPPPVPEVPDTAPANPKGAAASPPASAPVSGETPGAAAPATPAHPSR